VSLSDLARREAGAATVEAFDALSARLPGAVDLARQEGRDAERAAVVVWLREHEGRVRPVAWEILSAAADCIASGEHRREEEK
jgi:hypothetical protein